MTSGKSVKFMSRQASFLTLLSFLGILSLYAKRTIVEKHNRYALYHPSAEAISSMIMDMPYKIVNSILMNITLYVKIAVYPWGGIEKGRFVGSGVKRKCPRWVNMFLDPWYSAYNSSSICESWY